MAHTWNRGRACDHIDRKLDEVETVTVLDYMRDMSLENIPANKAYRVDAAHIYADILNLGDMLTITQAEGVRCHQQTLRFLNQHFRAAHRVIARTDARRVDFHNQRLHAIVAKPYGDEADDEADRVHHAVAIGQLLIDVLLETGDDHKEIPDAVMRIGIDSGRAFAVNNGRHGGREPLFLGDPANHAAKLASGAWAAGIYLTNAARSAIGLTKVAEPKATKLTSAEIGASQAAAALDVTKDQIVREWRADLEKNPIGVFEFTRHTPPLRTLDIAALTPGNSRRQEAVSMYADLDGFTAFVSRHVDERPEDVVKALHVIRAELDRTFTADFDGRRIRFIGDCLHGLLCEGTSQTTDEPATVSLATLCAGALRSSFELCLEKLDDAGVDVAGLGLQIGFELGPMTVTRLGMQGDRVRCSVSRGVLAAEARQLACKDNETAIGEAAHDAATEAVQDLFGDARKVADLDYNTAVEALAGDGDQTARASKSAALGVLTAVATVAAAVAIPAIVRSANVSVKPHVRGD